MQGPILSIDEALKEATFHHQAQRWSEAERLYLAILQMQPLHPVSNHTLGVMSVQLGWPAKALPYLKTAVEANPATAQYWLSYAEALRAAGRAQEARSVLAQGAQRGLRGEAFDRIWRWSEAIFGLLAQAIGLRDAGRLDESTLVCQRVLSMEPCQPDALHLLGLICHDQGRHGRFGDWVDRAVRIAGASTPYHANFGLALQLAGRLDEAGAAYRAAIGFRPDHAEAQSNLGNVLRDQGRYDDAVLAFRNAIHSRPDYAEAHDNLGNVRCDQRRFREAEAAYHFALALKPDHSPGYSNLGNALRDQGRLNAAQSAYHQAIRLDPAYAGAHCNLGNVLQGTRRFRDAIAAYDAAIGLNPSLADAYYNRGKTLKDQGQVDDAVTAYDRALSLRPSYAEAHYNRAMADLLRGNYSVGWKEYEWRWRLGHKGAAPRSFEKPQWDGGAINGRTILLHSEQGMGDSLQFCRYAPLAAAAGAKVLLEAPRSLTRLLRTLPGVEQIIATGDTLPFFDVHSPLMSLPAAFGTLVETIPAAVPYLSAESERIRVWRDRLGASGYKIGVMWQGSPQYQGDRERSVPLARFSPLAELSGVRLISLQKSHGLDQLEDLPAGMEVEQLGEDFDNGPDAFLDTAAVMMSLDLVVTVDTATGHLAGALGRPAWIALPAIPHWVWMLEREDSPWYPSLRLFRQTEPGNWSGVFARIADQLATVLA